MMNRELDDKEMNKIRRRINKRLSYGLSGLLNEHESNRAEDSESQHEDEEW